MSVSYTLDKRNELSKVLHSYVSNNNRKVFSECQARTMTMQEQVVQLELNHLHKQVGVLICELIVIRVLLLEQGSEDLKYVSNNINRITFSLVGQRRLLNLTKECYRRFAPDPKESESIDLFIQDIRARMEHLRGVSIPSNIELTPLKEYMDIIGGEDKFNQELRNMFYSKREEMFDEKGNVFEPLREYVNHVIKVVTDNNMIEPYQKRLNEYLVIEKEREKKKKQEFLEEKIAYEHNESIQGMNLFSKALYSCIRNHKENRKIGVFDRGKADNSGLKRAQGYIVLNCRLNRKGELEYRYVSSSGGCIKPFTSARHFETMEDAKQTAKEYEMKHPNMAFSVFDLSDEFGNTSGVELVI